MIALSVGVRAVRTAHTNDVRPNARIVKRRMAEIEPVTLPPARDHIIDGGQRKTLMSQMSVQHERESYHHSPNGAHTLAYLAQHRI